MFRRIGLKRTLQGLSLALVLLIVPVTVLAIRAVSSSVVEGRRDRTRRVVEVAAGIADFYVREADAGRLTREEAQARALAQLRALRYDGDQYFWINDFDARMVMHPVRPALEGRNLSDFRDPRGRAIFQQFAALGRSPGHGFVAYEWPRPGSAKPVPKVSYVQSVPRWGWVIGSGVYEDDVRASIARRRNELLAATAVAALVGLTLGWIAWHLIGDVRPPLAVVPGQHGHDGRAARSAGAR